MCVPFCAHHLWLPMRGCWGRHGAWRRHMRRGHAHECRPPAPLYLWCLAWPHATRSALQAGAAAAPFFGPQQRCVFDGGWGAGSCFKARTWPTVCAAGLGTADRQRDHHSCVPGVCWCMCAPAAVAVPTRGSARVCHTAQQHDSSSRGSRERLARRLCVSCLAYSSLFPLAATWVGTTVVHFVSTAPSLVAQCSKASAAMRGLLFVRGCVVLPHAPLPLYC